MNWLAHQKVIEKVLKNMVKEIEKASNTIVKQSKMVIRFFFVEMVEVLEMLNIFLQSLQVDLEKRGGVYRQ